MPHYAKYTTTVVGAHSVPRRHDVPGRLDLPDVDGGEQVAERIKAHGRPVPERTLRTGSRGFGHQLRHVALGKLRVTREAKAILTGDAA